MIRWPGLVGSLWALAPVAAGAVELPVADEPVRLDVTATTLGAWHGSNGGLSACDDNYGEGLERLNVTASRGGWGAGLRLDGSLYGGAPRPSAAGPGGVPPACYAPDRTDRYVNSVVPEKLWLTWSGRSFEVTAGDGYVSFGRGLALALRKSDELGVDTTLRGLRAKGSLGPVTGTLAGGVTNINNLDEASGRVAPDPNDLVLGAEVDLRVLDRLRVGAHGAAFAFQTPKSSSTPQGADESYRERWLTAGPTLDAPRLTDSLGLYLEGLVQQRTQVDGTRAEGFGLYGTLTAHGGPATVLFEGKAYGDLRIIQQPRIEPRVVPTKYYPVEFQSVQYATLPTVERLLQPLEHDQRDVAGGRARFDWTFSTSLTAYLNYGLFRDGQGYQDRLADPTELKPGVIHAPYAGADWTLGAMRVQAEAGWRGVYVNRVAAPVRGDAHFDVNATWGLGGGSSVELHLNDLERRKVLPSAEESWREASLQVGYRLRPYGAVAGVLDYTTDKVQPQVWYPGANVEWNFTPSSSIRVFAGASRGGLRCISGVCKIFPPFQGVKATLTARF